MNTKRVLAIVAGALVTGLLLGNVASTFAASTPPSGSSAPAVAAAGSGLGLRLGAAMKDSGGRLLDIVAKLTGKTAAQVVTERQAGKTFSQIASEKGVSASTVVDNALKIRAQVLAAKVKDGSTTQAQADTALASMKARLTTRVNAANASCTGAGAGGGGCAGGGLGAGCGGARCGMAGQ